MHTHRAVKTSAKHDVLGPVARNSLRDVTHHYFVALTAVYWHSVGGVVRQDFAAFLSASLYFSKIGAY